MRWLIAGYFFLIIFRPFEVWPAFNGLYLERIYTIFIIVGAFAYKKGKYYSSNVNNSLVLLLLSLCVSAITSDYPDNSFFWVEKIIKSSVGFFIIVTVLNDEKELKDLFISFLVIMFIYVGKSAWEFFINGRHEYRMGIVRMIGVDHTRSNPNSFGATIAYSLPFIVSILMYKGFKRWQILLAKAYIPLSAICIIMTGSRSSFVTCSLYILLLLKKSSHKTFKLGLVLFFILLTWQFIPLKYQNRFYSIIDPSVSTQNAQQSAESRIEHLRDGLRLYSEHPFWGIGLNNYRYHNSAGLQLHNLYGELLGETGTIGTLSFILLVFFIFKTTSLNKKLCRGDICNGERTTDHITPHLLGFTSHLQLVSICLYFCCSMETSVTTLVDIIGGLPELQQLLVIILVSGFYQKTRCQLTTR